MTINDALQSLVADLAAEGIADPLAEPLTLAAGHCQVSVPFGEGS